MTDFARLRLQHMRMAVLQLLEKVGGDVGESLLRAGLHDVGHRPVDLRAELEWLQSNGLVELAGGDGAAVVRLTEHGYAVAGGQDVVAGVARPRPGDR